MIQLIYGAKGSGKTKRLIDRTNAEAASASGTVVFIDDDKRYVRAVDSKVRFVNISEYGIDNEEKLYGFICGMYAQNYDIQAFYIDAFLKIVNKTPEELEAFFSRFAGFCERNGVKAVLSMSADAKKAPGFLKDWIL